MQPSKVVRYILAEAQDAESLLSSPQALVPRFEKHELRARALVSSLLIFANSRTTSALPLRAGHNRRLLLDSMLALGSDKKNARSGHCLETVGTCGAKRNVTEGLLSVLSHLHAVFLVQSVSSRAWKAQTPLGFELLVAFSQPDELTQEAFARPP